VLLWRPARHQCKHIFMCILPQAELYQLGLSGGQKNPPLDLHSFNRANRIAHSMQTAVKYQFCVSRAVPCGKKNPNTGLQRSRPEQQPLCRLIEKRLIQVQPLAIVESQTQVLGNAMRDDIQACPFAGSSPSREMIAPHTDSARPWNALRVARGKLPHADPTTNTLSV
jgi:hypothetical protein